MSMSKSMNMSMSTRYIEICEGGEYTCDVVDTIIRLRLLQMWIKIECFSDFIPRFNLLLF